MKQDVSERRNNWKAFMKGLGFGLFGVFTVPYLVYKTIKDISETGFFL